MNPFVPFSSTTVNCPVCNTAVSKDDVQQQLCCGHTYHKQCLDAHVEQNNFKCPAPLCKRVVVLHKKAMVHTLGETCRSILPPELRTRNFNGEGTGTPEERVAFFKDALAQFLEALPQPLADAVLVQVAQFKEAEYIIKNAKEQDIETLHRDFFEKILRLVVNS